MDELDVYLDTENLNYLKEAAKNLILYRQCVNEGEISTSKAYKSEFFKSMLREYRVRKNSYFRQANAVWNHQSAYSFVHFDGYNSYYVRYYTIPFDGTKEELLEYFDEYYASKINSPYDCTGEWFTVNACFAKVDEYHWLVRECLAKDI
jgi:RNA recognition motif-containing protein